ncbi:MAG: hypothetical protein IPK12_14570 [Gemmatimonadetes bacterium]|nr:hypothetical protein [Gemmatimonadota bacterium]
MVSLVQLWLPVLLGALAVFFASSLVHMVFKWHNSDYQRLPNEDEVRAAMRKGSPAPGGYVTPYCSDMKELADPGMQARFAEGPVAFIYVRPSGLPSMGPALGQWFVLNLVVAVFVAYLGSRLLAPGTPYLQVFRVAGTIAFVAYAIGHVSDGIWYGRPWRAVGKDLLDALLYALVTGGVFGSLWPKA